MHSLAIPEGIEIARCCSVARVRLTALARWTPEKQSKNEPIHFARYSGLIFCALVLCNATALDYVGIWLVTT